MFESLIFAVILMFLNVIFCIKPVPLLAMCISLFTLMLCPIYFVSDVNLPANSPNPYFTLLIGLIACFSLYLNWRDFKK